MCDAQVDAAWKENEEKKFEFLDNSSRDEVFSLAYVFLHFE